LEIIGFPSKQFGGQEFDTADEIAKFVTKFNVQFNLGAMTDVNGADAHPVFAWLKGVTRKPEDVRWNFATYWLVDKAGEAARFDGVKPTELVSEIESRLAAAAGGGAAAAL